MVGIVSRVSVLYFVLRESNVYLVDDDNLMVVR